MSKKSAKRGRSTLAVEVTNISARGFWLLLGDREWFVPYQRFPWFRDASVAAITKVKQPISGHLHWPALDIDLAVESIEHPARYPLVSRTRPGKLGQGASPRSAATPRHGARRSAGR